jgi:hypothetical protein
MEGEPQRIGRYGAGQLIAIIAVVLTGCTGLRDPLAPHEPTYSEKSLLLKQGMTEQEVTTVLGTPTKAESRTCVNEHTPGLGHCKTLTYGSDRQGLRAMFAENAAGELRLNDWTVH